jgi:hypothetical protein
MFVIKGLEKTILRTKHTINTDPKKVNTTSDISSFLTVENFGPCEYETSFE